MSRLEVRFQRNQQSGQKSLGIFLTAGYPTLEATDEILECLHDAEVDFIELGMPFSDPLAEGKTIQETSTLALQNGVNLKTVLDYVSRFRQRCDTPLLLMGYVNPVLQYGYSNFCRDAASSGVDGFIIPDLPVHESRDFRTSAGKAGLDVVHLITPNTTDNRIEQIDHNTTGFVYAVALIGLTGADLQGGDFVQDYLARARSRVKKNRLLAGFGIRTRADARALARHTDGVIVGTAFLQGVARKWSEYANDEEKKDAVQQFVDSVRPSGTLDTASR